MGGTGDSSVSFGNLPNEMERSAVVAKAFCYTEVHGHSVRQVAGRHRLVACATRTGTLI